jgi:hypothetical protein
VREVAAGTSYELGDRVEPRDEATIEWVHERLPAADVAGQLRMDPRDAPGIFEATPVTPPPHPP